MQIPRLELVDMPFFWIRCNRCWNWTSM